MLTDDDFMVIITYKYRNYNTKLCTIYVGIRSKRNTGEQIITTLKNEFLRKNNNYKRLKK